MSMSNLLGIQILFSSVIAPQMVVRCVRTICVVHVPCGRTICVVPFFLSHRPTAVKTVVFLFHMRFVSSLTCLKSIWHRSYSKYHQIIVVTLFMHQFCDACKWHLMMSWWCPDDVLMMHHHQASCLCAFMFSPLGLVVKGQCKEGWG